MASVHLLKISRLEGLTDGIFSIAMTIMVLNLHMPEHLPVNHLLPLLKTDILFNLFIYVGSFIILGTHWIAMNFQWGLLDRLNRLYLWTNMYYLMVICIVPFSANLLGCYPYSANSIYFYAANLMGASFGQWITFKCAHCYGLFKSTYTPAISRATIRRILVAPIFYLSAVLIAHWNMSIAFILLVAPTLIYIIPGQIDKYENI